MKLFSLKKKNTAGALDPLVRAHGSNHEPGSRVLRDWSIVIGVFVTLMILVTVIDGYLLVLINRGDFFKAATQSELAPETINRKKMLDVEQFFDARQKQYEAFSATTTPEIDPSL